MVKPPANGPPRTRWASRKWWVCQECFGRVLVKARFWQAHRSQALSAEQIKVLNRLLDGGEKGFENGISAAQYQAVAKVSKATATRNLSDLVEKGCLARLPGGGRSTRYQMQHLENAQG